MDPFLLAELKPSLWHTVPADAPWQGRLPFYFGWVIVAIAFITMAISVSARTAFSLLLPELIDEFGWDSGLAAGAFSFGFLVSAIASPFVGRIMDVHGPRLIIATGVALVGIGLFTAQLIVHPWQLYLTLGVLVGAGANLMSFTAQSLYLPNWFIRNRGFAISLAFSGVGVGAIVLLPWFQSIILNEGWRAACSAMGILVIFCLGPLAFFVKHRPEDVGLLPDGEIHSATTKRSPAKKVVVDHEWASINWTLSRAVRTARFWWIIVGYFCALFAWYAVQVHQTKYLTEIGYSALVAAWALGLVSIIAIPGQIGLGALSDRVGREWIWTIACFGFVVCYAALLAMEKTPTATLLY
ncbi:MAG: MFS transporter, partial [Hyphomicrobiaceae bacterium]